MTTPRKFSAPVKPKSGAIAAALTAATIAGGSGFLDARKEFQEEYQNMLKDKRSKAVVGDAPVVTTTETAQKEQPESKPATGDLPSDLKIPSGPVQCGCSNHLDKLESEIELPISAKSLYYLLFDDENPHYLDIWERKTVGNKSKGKKDLTRSLLFTSN